MKKPNNKWRRVAAADYYKAYESAGDIPLEAGMEVEVQWPDGIHRTDILHFEHGTGSAQIDMNGIPDNFQTRRLFVRVKVRGRWCPLYLKGLLIRVPEGRG